MASEPARSPRDDQVPATETGSATPEPDPDPERQPGFVEYPAVPGVQAGGGEQLAGAFLQRSFFLALHERAGHPDEHPRRGTACFWMDFVLRLISSLVLLAIAVVAAWKALAPLPWS